VAPNTAPRQTVERFLQAVSSGKPGDLADCYASEIVIEMPLAVNALYPSRIETTREELRARFEAGAAIRRYVALENAVIHETAEPDVLIVEYDVLVQMIDSGEEFSMTFLMVMHFRDGLIDRSRDYTDPIKGARALGKLDELMSALTP
jgi:ketosteroid isomerase-like protein